MALSTDDRSGLDNTTYTFEGYIDLGSLLNGKSIKISSPLESYEETVIVTDLVSGMQYFDKHPVTPQLSSIFMRLQTSDGTDIGSASSSEINYTNSTGSSRSLRLKVYGSVTLTQKVREFVTLTFAFDCGTTRDGMNTIIGYDGWASIFSGGHLYFGKSGAWIRYGQQGLRVTDQGVQVTTDGGSTWNTVRT
jgi:hypothetical protein